MLWENSLFFASPLPACGKQPCNLRVYLMHTVLVKPQFSARRESFQQTLRLCGMSAGRGEGRRFLTAHRSAAMGTWPPLAGEVGERERTRKGDAALSRPCAPPLRPFRGTSPHRGGKNGGRTFLPSSRGRRQRAARACLHPRCTGDVPLSPQAGDDGRGQPAPVYTRAAQGTHFSRRKQGTVAEGNERMIKRTHAKKTWFVTVYLWL